MAKNKVIAGDYNGKDIICVWGDASIVIPNSKPIDLRGSGYYEKKTCVFCGGSGYSDYDPYK